MKQNQPLIIQAICFLSILLSCDSHNTTNAENPTFDTLAYHLQNQSILGKDFYRNTFDSDYELSDIDKVTVKDIKPAINGLNPVILLFETIESDRKKQYLDLHLFDKQWKLVKSLSLDYEISYDLFHQEHKFINDSIIEIKQEEGLSFMNDSTIHRMFILKIDEAKILDTIRVQIDTLDM